MKKFLLTFLSSLLFAGVSFGQCPTITITPTSSTLQCGMNPATFTAATSPATNVIHIWEQPTCGSLSGLNCTPGIPGTYTFCAINQTSGCKTTQTVQVILGNTSIPQITVTAANNNFSIGCVPCVTVSFTGYIFGGAASGMRWMDPTMTNTLSVSNTYSTCVSNNYLVYAYNLSAPNCSVAAMITVFQNTSAISYISSTSPTLCVGQTSTLTAFGANSYTWSTSSNSNSIVVTPTVTTSYSATAINSTNSCTSTTVYNQVVSTCLGFQELNAKNEVVKIYPNPNSGIFNVQLGEGNKEVKVRLTNSIGQTIMYKEILTGETISFDISEFTNGIYILEIHNGKFVSGYKLVKN